MNVISKSGGTLEPAIAFRLVKELLLEKYGEEAYKRLVFTTDPTKGKLRGIWFRTSNPNACNPLKLLVVAIQFLHPCGNIPIGGCWL